MMIDFGNIITAMVTPFNQDGSVNYSMAVELAHYLIENGTTTLLLAGTTGESPTLTHEEELALFDVMVKTFKGKVCIMAGTGSNSTVTAIESSKKAEDLGVDCFLQVVPYYNKPTQEGMLQHFEAVADATSLPIMLYNIPGRTGVNMLPETIHQASLHPSIVAVKEAAGSVEQVTQIKQLVSADFQIYSGDDGLTLDFLKEGALGVVSVASHCVGFLLNQLVTSYHKGDVDVADQLHQQLAALFDVLFITSNPAPVKYALKRMGFDVGGLRLPLCEVTVSQKQHIDAVLVSLNLI